MRLFLDANILFSAVYHEEGVCRTFFDLAGSKRYTLFTSAYAVEEANRNLLRKAHFRHPDMKALLPHLHIVPEPSSEKTVRMASLPLAAKDTPILAAAVECCADILVTGDRRDFGQWFGQRMEGVLILRPADALDKILALF